MIRHASYSTYGKNEFWNAVLRDRIWTGELQNGEGM